MSLAAGTRLGAYDVIGLLGAGGMGQVYRARDTKLNRDVAIKVLPDDLARDPDRLARFTREAQTLAALNHPNIAHIHGLEETNGVVALVMELVEGNDLSCFIAGGPIRSPRRFHRAADRRSPRSGAQQGFVHRDLKPANVKVREDGTSSCSTSASPRRCCKTTRGRFPALSRTARRWHLPRSPAPA